MKAVIVILIITFTGFGQDNLTFKTQIRERTNVILHDGDMGDYHELRTRIGMMYKASEDVNAFIELQDSRTFGEQARDKEGKFISSQLQSKSNVDLYQAYMALNKMGGTDFNLRIGRVGVNYGSQRLVGTVGWHNIGRSFDGVTLTYKSSDYWVDFFTHNIVELGSGKLNSNDGDHKFSGVHYNGSFNKTTKFDAFFYNDNNDATSTTLNTVGAFLNGGMDMLSYTVEVAYQMGDKDSLDVAAYLVAANIGYKLSDDMKIILGYEIVSGDESGTDKDYGAFNTLYATNHKFYGHFDNFLNVPLHTDGRGLQDLYGTFAYKTLTATFHMFSYDQGSDTAIGNEIDIMYKYKYSKEVAIVPGLAFFSPDSKTFGKFNGESSTYIYTMFIFNF